MEPYNPVILQEMGKAVTICLKPHKWFDIFFLPLRITVLGNFFEKLNSVPPS